MPDTAPRGRRLAAEWPVIARRAPETPGFGATAPGIQHRHLGIIGMLSTASPTCFSGSPHSCLVEWVGHTARLMRPLVEAIRAHLLSAARVRAARLFLVMRLSLQVRERRGRTPALALQQKGMQPAEQEDRQNRAKISYRDIIFPCDELDLRNRHIGADGRR